jgi:Icc-related predicted phosphoesterase
MKVVMISDTHMQHKALTMPEGDILIHAGDWTHRGEEILTIEFLKWFNAQNYKHKVFIAGNHDFYPESHYMDFRMHLKTFAPSCTYLEDQSVVIEGYKIHGSPVSPWFCDWAFNRGRGDDIQQHWDMIPDDTEILITHGPILGYGDKLSAYGSEPGKNIGCLNLLDTIDKRLKDLKLHVSGHIHEGAGTYNHGNIIVVNASVLDERYRLRNSPAVIELADKPISESK